MPIPAISVVMPVYNGIRFLDRAMASLLAQTFSDWELLTVDDGSTDESAQRLEAFAAMEPRLRVFRHAVNRGQATARNTALAAARGEWVAYLDQDDEFHPDHLARVWEWRSKAEVLLFRYELVEERPTHPLFGQVRTYDPKPRAGRMFTETIAVPLGVVHRRGLLDRVGNFDELLGRYRGQDEDGDLWRRFARAGATFTAVPHSSGRYHVRPDSVARTRPMPTVIEAKPRVMFASYHSYHDPASGAAICTRDLFAALAARAWRVGAITGPQLDDRAALPVGEVLRSQPETRSASGRAGTAAFSIHTVHGPGGFPVTVFDPIQKSPTRHPSPEETAAFLSLVREVMGRFRPDVVLTYGGDPASHGIHAVARSVGAKVVFWLHNFAYKTRSAFTGCDAVIVPSAFSREHHRTTLGLQCVDLPPVIDRSRVLVERPELGKYLTFVNPVPEKGVFWFARLAQVLGRERPDIPMLIVEGRGRADWLGRCGVDLRGVTSFRKMANTPDPRQFYRLSKLLLVPSVGNESFGRVAVEAMVNGIPVLASDRGALPEVVGSCLALPTRLQPESRTPPTEADVASWVEAILSLWDDSVRYSEAAAGSTTAAAQWHPDVVTPRWEAFLARLGTRPSSRNTGISSA